MKIIKCRFCKSEALSVPKDSPMFGTCKKCWETDRGKSRADRKEP